MKKIVAHCLGILFLFAFAGVVQNAHAATNAHSCAIPRSRLDWRLDAASGSDTIKHCVVPQFDPSVGTLTEVSLAIQSDTDTVQKVENKDASPHSMSANVTVHLTMEDEDGQAVATVEIPTANESFNASAFDGTVDYKGTSGKTFDPAYGSSTKTISLTDPDAISKFIGTGNYDFPVLADALWQCSGSGNAACEVDTYASAEVTVTYVYNPPVPDIIFNSCTAVDVVNGETQNYIITSSNQGTASITSEITITDTLPECLDHVDTDHGSWACTFDDGENMATCTFTGVVPPNAFLPELPMAVSANNCSDTSLTHVVRAYVDGETNTQNNSLSCAVAIEQTSTNPTPTVTPSVLNENATPTPSPAVLPAEDTDEPGVLASTGMKLFVPTIIGALLVVGAIIIRRKRSVVPTETNS